MHKRSLTSFVTFIGFFVVAISGLVLFVTPRGWAANRLDWTLLGLSKHEWTDIHLIFSMLWMAAVVIHIYLNWRVLKAFTYKKARGGWRRRKEMAVAVGLVAAVFAATLYDAPPVKYITDLSDKLKSTWVTGTYQAAAHRTEGRGGDRFGRRSGPDPPEYRAPASNTPDFAARWDASIEPSNIP